MYAPNRLCASQLDAIVGEAKAKIRIVDVACGRRHMFLTFVNTDSEVILFALAVAIGEPITPAIEVLRKARCAPPGDPKLPRGLSR